MGMREGGTARGRLPAPGSKLAMVPTVRGFRFLLTVAS
jgi:hypothetical protein